jgi:hypothetical protein
MKYIKLENSFVRWENGNYGHCSLLKIVVNTFLRLLQFYSCKPYVIASIVSITPKLKFHKYEINRVRYQRRNLIGLLFLYKLI